MENHPYACSHSHSHMYIYIVEMVMEMRIGVEMRMRVGLCGRLTQSGDQNISRSSNKLHTSGLEGGSGCGRLSGILTVGRTFFLINLCGMRYALNRDILGGEERG